MSGEEAEAEMGERRPAGERRALVLIRRHRAERRFRLYGLAAIAIALGALATILVSIALSGVGAFRRTEIRLEIAFEAHVIDPAGTRDPAALRRADYTALVRDALFAHFPDVSGRRELRRLAGLLSFGAADRLRRMVLEDPGIIGTTRSLWLPASDDVDMLMKGNISRGMPESRRRISDAEIAWIDVLAAKGLVAVRWHPGFLTSGDSREPELAGVGGAIVGSFLTLLVTFILAFPIGVMTAVYLEEFAPQNRWTDLVEVNINNLAAVPSIVFGLLGLAVFLNVFGLPRSASLVGGFTLALMTLPTIIITGRAALTAVPPSVKEAALAVGASHFQAVMHHVLPSALPGILTGSIIGLARALGETAPLLMIGMVAFIVDIPAGVLDPAAPLPVQIYLWVDSPERAFVEKTSGAILVLILFLVAMNGAAIYLRHKVERKW